MRATLNTEQKNEYTFEFVLRCMGMNNLITFAGSSFMQAFFRLNVFQQTLKHTLHYNLHTSVVRKRERNEEKRTKKKNNILPLHSYSNLFLHTLFYRYRTVWFEKFPASLNILTSPIIECMNLSPSGVTKQQQQQKSSWCIYPSLSIAVSLRLCFVCAQTHTKEKENVSYDPWLYPKSLGGCQGLLVWVRS